MANQHQVIRESLYCSNFLSRLHPRRLSNYSSFIQFARYWNHLCPLWKQMEVYELWHTAIPDICHQYHQYICGEKSVMWRNFRFQYSIWNFSTCKGISDFSTQQMWRNVKFCQIWRNFTFLHRTDVKKSEIYPVFCHRVCFTLFLWDPFWRDLRAFAWRKI